MIKLFWFAVFLLLTLRTLKSLRKEITMINIVEIIIFPTLMISITLMGVFNHTIDIFLNITAVASVIVGIIVDFQQIFSRKK